MKTCGCRTGTAPFILNLKYHLLQREKEHKMERETF